MLFGPKAWFQDDESILWLGVVVLNGYQRDSLCGLFRGSPARQFRLCIGAPLDGGFEK